MLGRHEDRREEEAPLKRLPSTGPTLGLGLRWELADELLASDLPEIDFLEITPENYAGRGGAAATLLATARARFPLVTHGLTLSLGGTDPLDDATVDLVASVVREVGSPWHSDHLAMTAHGGVVLHDLLPVPRTRAHASVVARRVRRVAERIGVPMCVENVSAYVVLGEAEVSEAEFVRQVIEEADCGLLFDVNNAVVNAQNFGDDLAGWLDARLLRRIRQIHVAGHEWFDYAAGELTPLPPGGDYAADRPGRLAVDTHGAPAQPAVRELLREVVSRRGPVPVLLERDENIPPLAALLGELRELRAVVDDALAAAKAPYLAARF